MPTEAELSDEKLAELLAGCEGTTPGPWRAGHLADPNHSCNCTFVFGNVDRMGAVATVHIDHAVREHTWQYDDPPVAEATANLKHIVRCSPDTIRALVTEIIAVRTPDIARAEPTERVSDDKLASWLSAADVDPEFVEVVREVLDYRLTNTRSVTPIAWYDRDGIAMLTIDGKDYALNYVREAVENHIRPATPDIARGEGVGDWVLVPRQEPENGYPEEMITAATAYLRTRSGDPTIDDRFGQRFNWHEFFAAVLSAVPAPNRAGGGE